MDSKYLVECFGLETRESQPNGAARAHRQSKERIRAQGQGNVLVLEVRILSRDALCDHAIELFTSSLPGLAPSEGGQQVKLKYNGTGNLDRVVLNTVGRHFIETETRLQANVEVVLEVLASSGGNQVRGQAVVVATVYAQ
jgi:hypothetical protein